MPKHKETLEKICNTFRILSLLNLAEPNGIRFLKYKKDSKISNMTNCLTHGVQKLKKALEVCKNLLKNATVFKVSYSVMKNRAGYYENGGESYFWTEKKAEAFIADFMKSESGWTSKIEEPEEVDLADVDLADLEE